ncbi:MAG TPA: LPXTG cell wall anchor domain-containing protein [Catenuloplanes sp.]|jgi:LPXTG-motif cell wall-anchored protein
MRHHISRRVLAGFGAAVAALGFAAVPAAAAADKVRLGLFFPELTVAADGPPNAGAVFLHADLPYVTETPTKLEHLRVTVDFSAAAELVTVSQLKDSPLDNELTCSTSGTVLTCTGDDAEHLYRELELQPLSLQVKAKAKAKAGEAAKLKITAQFDGVRPVSYESTVRIGEGVDLAAGETPRISTRIGERVDLRPEVRNVGKLAATGAVLVLPGDAGLPLAKRFTNCTYGDVVACTFPENLEPGKGYRISAPLTATVPRDMPAPSTVTLLGMWLTPDDWNLLRETLEISVGAPGAGSALALTPTTTKAARVPQTDIDMLNNGLVYEIAVTGANPADVAAIGATVTGGRGATVPLTVGVRNNGPATINATMPRNFTFVGVTVPARTTVVKVDENCLPTWDKDEELGAPEYVCFPAERLAAGAATQFRFSLRLDADITNGVGGVRVNDAELFYVVETDRNKGNDAAKIVVNPGAGGTGGGLPVTGATTGLLAGSGALLLLAGVAGFVLARRRRPRFTA